MSNIANFPILYQYERGNKVPIDLHGSFSTMDAALTYLRAYKDINVYAGQLISIGTGEDVKLYIVKSNTSGEYRLEETGGSVKQVTTKSEIDAFATSDNIGKQFYITSDIVSGSGESLKVDYATGLYVVTGDKSYQKLATSSASGDLAGDVTKLEGRVGTLENSLGDSTKGLTKEVNTLKSTVGDSTSGLVKQVADLETKHNTLNNSVVKDVKVNTTAGATSVVQGGVATIDLSSYATLENLNQKVSSVFVYKGTKAAYANLPTADNIKGDVWNVEQGFTLGGKIYPAGTNVAWNGSTWDPLGGELDLSNYFNKTEVQDAIDSTISSTNYLKGFTVNGSEHEAKTVGGDHLVFETGDNLNVALNDNEDGIKISLTEAFVKTVTDTKTLTDSLVDPVNGSLYYLKTTLPNFVNGTVTLSDKELVAIEQAVQAGKPIIGMVYEGSGTFEFGIINLTSGSTYDLQFFGIKGIIRTFALHPSSRIVTCTGIQEYTAKQGTSTDASSALTLYGVKNSVGSLDNLNTSNKTNVVAAINEVAETLDWEEVN